MGNTHVKPHPRQRNKKQVRWKAAGSVISCFGSGRLRKDSEARPQPPGKPQLISEVESTPDLVTICWTPPPSDGGSPISGYLVEHRRTGSPHWVRSTPILIQAPEVTVSGLEPGWRYQFRISAQNAVGISDPSDLSEPITVTFQRSAITAPRFTQDVRETTALENDKAEFIVHFLGQPPPRVSWYKDEFEIFSSRRIRIVTESDKSILTIYQCSLSDEGEIKCTATNRAGHVSSKAKLAIEAPPSIRLPRQYEDGLLFEIGESIKLKVSVAGRPTPLVFWSHDGESINNNDRYEIEHADKMSILKIGEATRGDRGEYEVKAVNKLGQHVQSFSVTVTDKPSPPGKAKVVMTLGRSVTLSWSTPQDDGGCQIGNYIIEYYRLGWNVWLKAATSRQVTTILGDLIEGSEYKFRVKAESPYGISEPSEETEVVFIPDPRRGILAPPARGRSQPRDVSHGTITPIARRKHRNRSQSSSRVETSYLTSDPSVPVAPKRPERTKIKSPPKTPEASPLVKKREVDAKANRKIFEQSDRSSMARELSYGSPEIKLKRDAPKTNLAITHNSSGSEKSRTPSPSSMKAKDHKVYKVKIESPIIDDGTVKRKSPSPEKPKQNPPRQNNGNFTGSSEFMLVLYPGENQKGKSGFDFDNDSVPPPMSLSAPELGADSPIFDLRRSASSTELLHEKTMMRLYEAAEAEEEELKRRERMSDNEIPKILINSKDNQKIVGLDRKHSLVRRLSAGGLVQQQTLWSQRRHTIVSPVELKDDVIPEEKLRKFPATLLDKRDSMMLRQRSEEMDENVLKDIRRKSDLAKQSSTEQRQLSVANEDKLADDYESSTEDSESSEADDELRDIEKRYKKFSYEDEGEEETYHPRLMTGLSMHPPNDKEPFEILTKRKEPPSPDFVPKPILKKVEPEKEFKDVNFLPPTPNPRSRSHSPLPPNSPQRSRSQSIAGGSFTMPLMQKPVPDGKLGVSRPRSFSLVPQAELAAKRVTLNDRPLILEKPKPFSLMHSISAVATVSGITAASIVIPDRLIERQKDAEEAKVVIDHYGDIVKSYGRRKSSPQIFTDRDSLKKAAENEEYMRKVGPTASKPKVDLHRSDFQQKEAMSSTFKTNGDKSISSQDNGVSHKARYDDSDTSEYDSNKSEDKSRFSHMYEHFEGYQQENVNSKPKTIDNMKQEGSFSKSPSNISDSNPTILRNEYQNFTSTAVDGSARKTPTLPDARAKQRRTSPSPIRKQSMSPTTEYARNISPATVTDWTSPLANSRQGRRRTSSSSIRSSITKTPPGTDYSSGRSTPSPLRRERPTFREIMTQTSGELASFDSDSNSRTSSPFGRTQRQEELLAEAEVKVHRFIDYVTDLAMFVVACWLYLFGNELLAIPVLIVMVYRQLQVEIMKRIPKWLLRRIKRRHRK